MAKTKKRNKSKASNSLAINTLSCDKDKAWQGQCDARTLAEAKVIMSDKKRLNAAAQEASKMAEKQMEEAKAMKSISKKGKS